MGDIVVSLNHITKKYGRKTILNDVSFEAKLGEAVVLAGRNGGGKTVMLKIALDLIRKFRGERKVTSITLMAHIRYNTSGVVKEETF